MLSCLYEEDRLAEVILQPDGGNVRVGNIYIGKVMKIVSNIDAAFVAIAPGVNGYYSLKENRQHLFAGKEAGSKLACGDEILVQISRENLKTKAWTLSSAISLAGDFVVLDSGYDQIRISSKIKNEHLREKLAEIAMESRSDTASYGLTVRTAASQMPAGCVKEEVRRLERIYRDLMASYRTRTCYSRIYTADPDHIKMMRRYMYDRDFMLTTDIPEVFEEARACFAEAGMVSEGEQKVHFYQDSSWPLIKLKNIEAQLEKALAAKVWMRSGAYLVIEQTEAMTVIDVNTGKNLNKKDNERHFLDVNLEAAEEICRQIRLRNLSGIIIVDFINMKDPENGQLLMQRLRELAAQDPVQLTVVDRTRLQLVEMTRRKVRRTLSQQFIS